MINYMPNHIRLYKVVYCYDDKYGKPVQIDIILTTVDERTFRKADKCYICNKQYSAKDIRVRDHCHIRNNMEKYMAFMLGKHLVFIDSLQFMSSSLDRLVRNLPNDAFKYTSEEIKNDKKLKLMKQKGVYPYDYMDSFNRFSEKKLPNKDDFYSILNDEHISDTQYVHAIKV